MAQLASCHSWEADILLNISNGIQIVLREDCFLWLVRKVESCLRIGLIRHRRSKKPHTFFSKSSPRFSRGDPSNLMNLFVTLVTEVSLISREPNLRFERISISRGILWKSFSSFPFCTRHILPVFSNKANFPATESRDTNQKAIRDRSSKVEMQFTFNVSNLLVRIGSV